MAQTRHNSEDNRGRSLGAAQKYNEGAQIYTLDADGTNKTAI